MSFEPKSFSFTFKHSNKGLRIKNSSTGSHIFVFIYNKNLKKTNTVSKQSLLSINGGKEKAKQYIIKNKRKLRNSSPHKHQFDASIEPSFIVGVRSQARHVRAEIYEFT